MLLIVQFFYDTLTFTCVYYLYDNNKNNINNDKEGDDLKLEDPLKAIEMFEKVVDLETARGDVVKW
jgi:hypothetical protein